MLAHLDINSNIELKKLYDFQDKLLEQDINSTKKFIPIYKKRLDNLHLLFTTFYKLSNKYNLSNKSIQIIWDLFNWIQKNLNNVIKFCVIRLEFDQTKNLKEVVSNLQKLSLNFNSSDKKENLQIIKIINKQLDNCVKI